MNQQSEIPNQQLLRLFVYGTLKKGFWNFDRFSAGPLADTRTQNIIELPENAMTQPEGDWDLVHGELMTFTNPGFDLPPIDRLEAFDPNGRCVYTRVLVAVESNDLIRPVWLYNYKLGHNMERIASGRWYPS
ncbi:MAG: gamma-glutamylcyclotransferase family protein [bacterium]